MPASMSSGEPWTSRRKEEWEMQYSTKCSDLVKVSEGLRLKVYLDTAGNPTIAYGHKLRAGESFSNGIDVPTACVLLSQDLSTAAAAVGRLVKVPLTQGQIDALVDFVFNLGALLLANSTLLRYLNNGDYENAAFHLKLW